MNESLIHYLLVNIRNLKEMLFCECILDVPDYNEVKPSICAQIEAICRIVEKDYSSKIAQRFQALAIDYIFFLPKYINDFNKTILYPENNLIDALINEFFSDVDKDRLDIMIQKFEKEFIEIEENNPNTEKTISMFYECCDDFVTKICKLLETQLLQQK